MSPTLPLATTGLTLGFNEPEDRLVLIAADAAGGRLPMLMTRRLTQRLLNGLASLIESSSVVASQAPADLRDDIILMEHQDAVFGRHDAPAHSEPAQVDAPTDDLAPARLVTHIDVTVTPQGSCWCFATPGSLRPRSASPVWQRIACWRPSASKPRLQVGI